MSKQIRAKLLKKLNFPVPPADRNLEQWARRGTRVVFVEVSGRQAKIITGFISRPEHRGDLDFVAGEPQQIGIWFDQKMSEADNADDAHERFFSIDDIRVLRVAEAHLLIQPKVCEEWFRLGSYPMLDIQGVCDALTSTRFENLNIVSLPTE